MNDAPAHDARELAMAARRVPLVKSYVLDFAARHALPELSAAFAVALPIAGADAATVLAMACTHLGGRLDASVVRKLLPELESVLYFGCLMLAADGDPVDLLLAFLDDGAGASEREAFAVLLAADLASPPPPRLLAHARKMARRPLGFEAGLVLSGAVSRIADPHLDALMASRAKDPSAPGVAENMLRIARTTPTELLSSTVPPRLSTGYTVRSERAAGRNDPCPCGSGKKYKKCCADKRENPTDPAPIDPRVLTTAQVGDLRASEIAQLDPRLLSRRACIEGFRRLIGFRRWDAAERFLDAIGASEGKEGLDEWRAELVDEAIDQGAHDVAQRHIARLPAPLIDRRLRILLDCIERPADLIDRLHAHAREALEEEERDDGGDHVGLSLAFAMMEYFPALGVFVARGALTKARLLDSYTLLESMEEARDELGIAPFEPWWDIWEQIEEASTRLEQTKAQREEHERITADLRRARAQADATAAEAAYLQRRLRELEAAKTKDETPRPAVERSTSSTDIEEEKRRLRTKVAELQRIVSEGQEERRNLRRSLASASTSAERSPPSPPSPPNPPTSDADEAAEEDHDESTESVSRPRRVLIPTYQARAAKAIGELTGEVAESILMLVAELAAGREHAWRGVKRLRTRDVLSARAGIHYRVLFEIDDRSLAVVSVTHRRDLVQALASL